jgi:thiol-disulfide isomerase/thioredoxin
MVPCLGKDRGFLFWRGPLYNEVMSLLNFYGEECPHCHTMMPMIDKLEQELGVKVERLETWHNDKNAELMSEYDKDLCGGVPFFYNTDAKKWVCGEASYEELKNWAEGK